MNGEFGYLLAFATGVFGAFHCLGMCSGIAGGFFVLHGGQRRLLSQLYYHGTRILVYTGLGVAGALVGRVLVQTGLLGKGQGILMMTAGLLISLIGLALLGVLPIRGPQRINPQVVDPSGDQLAGQPVPFYREYVAGRTWPPALAGLFNGLVPCSLVFSVAVKAAAVADPLRAGLLMAAFGLGTLPTMVALSLLGALVGSRVRGVAERLAGISVLALGLWTLYEGFVFFDIMRGLGNW